MAWRIADSVVRGEIDNRLHGIIKGTLYLEGLKEPVTLELEGNCEPDLAGRHLTFRNLMPATSRSFEGFGLVQCGEAGTFSADRVVRIRIGQVNGVAPHPLVRRVSEFALQLIFESKTNRFFEEKAIQNQPLEGMIEATVRASVRLAQAMAASTGHERAEKAGQIVHGLKRARWSLAEASEHAGLANYMGSADTSWLKKIRYELRAMRKELCCLIHDTEERNEESAPSNGAAPREAAPPSNSVTEEGQRQPDV